MTPALTPAPALAPALVPAPALAPAPAPTPAPAPDGREAVRLAVSDAPEAAHTPTSPASMVTVTYAITTQGREVMRASILVPAHSPTTYVSSLIQQAWLRTGRDCKTVLQYGWARTAEDLARFSLVRVSLHADGLGGSNHTPPSPAALALAPPGLHLQANNPVNRTQTVA
jgi:hypothetical protein